MKEYRIGEVFEDAENFDPPKRLKCVEDEHGHCKDCACDSFPLACINFACSSHREDGTSVHFIETTEPIGKIFPETVNRIAK